MIYLDYASNTPADAAVLDVFCRTEAGFPGNPNSDHPLGHAANEVLVRNTEAIARLLGVLPEEIILTSGASEANNLAIKGIAHAYRHSGKHILTTCLEHPSVSGSLTALQEQGYEVELIPLCADGKANLQSLREMLRRDTVLVSLCFVDSELGAIQPIAEIAEILRAFPTCHFHVDATQACGKIPLTLDGIHCLTLAPHKLFGLNGCGVLVRRSEVILTPQIHGGAGVSAYRSGTPAIALAAASAKALELAFSEREARYARVCALRRFLEDKLTSYSGVRINSPADGVPHILNLSVDGVKGVLFQKALGEKGVCVSVKSACSVPGTPSRPVFAITKDRKNALCSWRISLSHLTTENELEQFIQIFDECYKEIRP